jgi:hypothetical protein
MRSKGNPEVDELFEQWKKEHCELDKYAMELSAWVHQQSQQREMQFREAVTRLGELNKKLAVHFTKEAEIGKQLLAIQGEHTPEAEALQRQAERDHSNIISRITHLIDRMQDVEAERDAWKDSMFELNLIIDVLEQHEEQEAESVGWLIPRQSCK